MRTRHLLISLSLLGACHRSAPPFQHSIDVSLAPSGSTVPLAAVSDDRGITDTFIEDQIVFSPKNKAELDAFVAEHGATVIATNAVPSPPPGSGIRFDPARFPVTEYTLRVTPKPAQRFDEDARALGAGGHTRISSEAGLRLLGLTSAAQRRGLAVSPNFVRRPTGNMLFSTAEEPKDGGTFANAFNDPAFKASEKASVSRAWQFVAAHGIARRVKLAIIDIGFWLQPNGAPMPGGVSDLPAQPLQYDFISDDYFADGGNTDCAGKPHGCIWHGNGSASVAGGILDNRYGNAGTGGQVVDPMLFKIDLSDGQLKRAVRTAQAWGADIVSMSVSGSCGWWCRLGEGNYARPFNDASDAGVTLIASAGNDGKNARDANYEPCNLKPVTCVGALETGSLSRATYSNYGGLLWAPGTNWVMPDGESKGATFSFRGTSSAAPFVAGVAAMMKAMNPSLDGSAIDFMLTKTAWTNSTDPEVRYAINAYAAVAEAAGNRLFTDRYEPDDTAQTPASLALNKKYSQLTLQTAGDKDFYRYRIDDYSELLLEIDFVGGLGGFSYRNVRETAAGGLAEGVTTTSKTNQHVYKAKLIPPGSYLLSIQGDAPNLYSIGLGARTVGLRPDQFEANNTRAAAKEPDWGERSFDVNLHTASDVDFYRFELPPLDPEDHLTYAFVVSDSDFPVTLEAYDFLGRRIGSATDRLRLPASGTYVVKVSGKQATRYTFRLYHGIDPEFLRITVPVAIRHFEWWPGVHPLELGREPIAIGFRQDGKLARATIVADEKVQMALLDAEGKVLREADAAVLSLDDTRPGQAYVIRLTRREREPDTALPIRFALDSRAHKE